MAEKTTRFYMRIDEKKKKEAEVLFRTLGMTLPQAINMFISQSLLVGGIPFDVRVPRCNQETVAAIQEAEDIISEKIKTKTYHSAGDLFEELDNIKQG